MKNIIIGIICAAGVLASAQSWLVRVPLTNQDLDPLFDQGLRIVAQIDNSALVLAAPAEMQAGWDVLDSDAERGTFYLALLLEPDLDLSPHGDILMREGQNVLLRLRPGGLDGLMAERVMLKKIFLRPIVRQPRAPSPAMQADPVIQEIVNLVSADSILNAVRRLQNFQTRYSTYDSCRAAANWIASRFLAYGCDTVYLQTHTSGHAPNVVAVKRGALYPDDIYGVICGHFDSYSYSGQNFAPGADDNASGTVAAIEAARVMKNYEFEFSCRYLAFSGEEFGLYGSEYYASQAYGNGDSILGVFNGDMIAYADHLPESLEVMTRVSNPPCEPLADFFIACADTYTTLLTHKQLTSNWQPSDNQSFLDYGYPALMHIEDFYPINPYYHYPGDTIGGGYNNNAFCTEATKAEIAALATLVRPYAAAAEEPVGPSARPSGFQLEVTPNPFITDIRFTIHDSRSMDKELSLEIYDASGRLIRSFVLPTTYSLLSSVVWDGTDQTCHAVPPGVYFIRLESAGQTLTRTVVKTR